MDDRIAYSLDNPPALQHAGELAAFVELLQRENVQSYLEIGARYGGTFGHVMMSLPNCRGTFVEFPDGNFGDDISLPFLLNMLVRLRNLGRDIKAVLGPSSAPEVIERVRQNGPYDAILIDADHSYDAARRDFETYAPMGTRILAFHDIVGGDQHEKGKPVEIPRLWAELRTSAWSFGAPYEEIIQPGSIMGIGVLFQDGRYATKGYDHLRVGEQKTA